MIILYLFIIVNSFLFNNCYNKLKPTKSTWPALNSTPIFNVNETLTNYMILSFNEITESCKHENWFRYRENETLSFIGLHSNTNGIYSFISSKSGASAKILVAVKNDYDLIAIGIPQVSTSQEYLIQRFDSKIILLQTQWIYNHVYLITKNDNDSKATLYMIDLYNIIVIKLAVINDLHPKDQILLSSYPLKGYISYVVRDRVYFVDLRFYPLESKIKRPHAFTIANLTETANNTKFCNLRNVGSIRYISSEINPLVDEMYTVYVVTGNNTKKKCIYKQKDCECKTMVNNEKIQKLDKLVKFANENCKMSNISNNNNTKIITNKASSLNNYFNKLNVEECLRICPTILDKLDVWELPQVDFDSNIDQSYRDYKIPCTNNLKFSSDVGKLRLLNETTLNFLFYDKYLDNCNISIKNENGTIIENININSKFKYTFLVKSLNQLIDANNLTGYDKFDYNMEFEVINDRKFEYNEINAIFPSNSLFMVKMFVQTVFDLPYTIGTYIINLTGNNKTNETSSSIDIVETPLYIYDNNYFFAIGLNAARIKFYTSPISLCTNPNDTTTPFSYLLTNTNSNITKIYEIKCTSLNYTNYKINNFIEIVFDITGLQENSVYSIRIIKSSNIIYTMSNLILFKTLKSPEYNIKLIKGRLILNASLKCRSFIYDYDSEYDVFETKGTISSFNCHKIEILTRDLFNESPWYDFDEYHLWSNGKKPNYTRNDVYLDTKDQYTSINAGFINLKRLSENTTYGITLIFIYYSGLVIEKTFNISSNVSENNSVTMNEFNGLANVTDKILKQPIEKNSQTTTDLIILVAALILLILIIIGLLIYAFKKRLLVQKYIQFLPADLPTLHLNALYVPSTEHNMLKYFKKEVTSKLKKIDSDQVTLDNKIGTGTFGDVYIGKLKMPNDETVKQVAIKVLKAAPMNSERIDLLKEAIVMSLYDHENIIEFHGICFQRGSPKYMVLEYMNLGDLLSYLRKNRNTNEICFKSVVEICLDVAKGCEFLEGIKVVHRDIAARNCLVSTIVEDTTNNEEIKSDRKIIVKLGDFGLAREMYSTDYYKHDGRNPLPIRWMSPESLVDAISTSFSDVWSFGVLIWEIMTMGQQPYQGLENKQVIDYVKNGGTPLLTSKCPHEMKDIMTKCWNMTIEERPTFKSIVNELNKIYEQNVQMNWSIYKNVLPIFDDAYSCRSSSTTKSYQLNSQNSIEFDDQSAFSGSTGVSLTRTISTNNTDYSSLSQSNTNNPDASFDTKYLNNFSDCSFSKILNFVAINNDNYNDIIECKKFNEIDVNNQINHNNNIIIPAFKV